MQNTACNYQIDYSAVPGEPVFPFVISLNTEDSVLNPQEGQKQRFCYEIQGVGQNTPRYADLSQFVFGICGSITRGDLSDISVSVNGDPQNIVWGENVEIVLPGELDNPPGCSGLKFNFPVNKETGILTVCYSLNTPYQVGPVKVCLYGAGAAASGLSVCGPVCGKEAACESVFYQRETVSVPVYVAPFAETGTPRVSCCGTPTVLAEPGRYGTLPSCVFTVTQALCIEVPISFGAVVETGETSVQCGNAAETGCGCGEGRRRG